MHDNCIGCQGAGKRYYASTATWHDAELAGAAMTMDICDVCWGSGFEDKPWTNLLRIERGYRILLEAAKASLDTMLGDGPGDASYYLEEGLKEVASL